MIKIIKSEVKKAEEKRYNVQNVAKAIGKSEGQVRGYFTNKHISTKKGITISQVAEVCFSRIRGESINWDDVAEIRSELEEKYGISIVEE